jgi:hypothetical protein
MHILHTTLRFTLCTLVEEMDILLNMIRIKYDGIRQADVPSDKNTVRLSQCGKCPYVPDHNATLKQ